MAETDTLLFYKSLNTISDSLTVTTTLPSLSTTHQLSTLEDLSLPSPGDYYLQLNEEYSEIQLRNNNPTGTSFVDSDCSTIPIDSIRSDDSCAVATHSFVSLEKFGGLERRTKSSIRLAPLGGDCEKETNLLSPPVSVLGPLKWDYAADLASLSVRHFSCMDSGESHFKVKPGFQFEEMSGYDTALIPTIDIDVKAESVSFVSSPDPADDDFQASADILEDDDEVIENLPTDPIINMMHYSSPDSTTNSNKQQPAAEHSSTTNSKVSTSRTSTSALATTRYVPPGQTRPSTSSTRSSLTLKNMSRHSSVGKGKTLEDDYVDKGEDGTLKLSSSSSINSLPHVSSMHEISVKRSQRQCDCYRPNVFKSPEVPPRRGKFDLNLFDEGDNSFSGACNIISVLCRHVKKLELTQSELKSRKMVIKRLLRLLSEKGGGRVPSELDTVAEPVPASRRAPVTKKCHLHSGYYLAMDQCWNKKQGYLSLHQMPVQAVNLQQCAKQRENILLPDSQIVRSGRLTTRKKEKSLETILKEKHYRQLVNRQRMVSYGNKIRDALLQANNGGRY